MPRKKQPKTTTFKGRTHICFILDKSGSMGKQRDSAISGFNEYITDQQKVVDDTVLSLILFDTTIVTPFVDVPIAEVRPITLHDYVPSGCTALFDAVGRGIAITESKVKKNDRALFVILTDGLENASKQITSHEQIRDIIKMKEKEGNWTFTYMGCGENWQQEAAAMNIARGNMTQLDSNDLHNSILTASAGTRSYRAGGAMMATNFYAGAPQPVAPGTSQPPARVGHQPIARPGRQPAVAHQAVNPFSHGSQPAVDGDLKDLLKRAQKR